MPSILVFQDIQFMIHNLHLISGFRMSAYEEIINQLSKEDKNGFSLWNFFLLGLWLEVLYLILIRIHTLSMLIRSWTADGLPDRSDKNSNTN